MEFASRKQHGTSTGTFAESKKLISRQMKKHTDHQAEIIWSIFQIVTMKIENSLLTAEHLST